MTPMRYLKSEKVGEIKRLLLRAMSVLHLKFAIGLNTFFHTQNLCYSLLRDYFRSIWDSHGTPEQLHSSLRECRSESGDVPGWVLVVLMTAGLVTGIWTVAAPRLNLILRNSLDSMNAIR
jgi:hypothetical protein